jgi:hypothetical protein
MDFKQNLINKLKQRDLSESSIKMYVRNIEKLAGKPLKNLNFLKNKEEILDKISKYKPNTRRSYIISIVSVLDKEKDKKLYDYYYRLMMDMNKSYKEEASKNEKSETQKENWIEWEEVESKLQELEEQVKKYKKNISEEEYNKVLQYIILSLYVYNPPRRNQDYSYMNIVKNKEPEDKTLNYLIYDENKFVFNKFKTAKKEGSSEIEIGDNLMNSINLYLKYHPLLKGKKITKNTNLPFLVKYNGEPLNKSVNTITYILNRIFKKKISSSMLRHIYLSNKYGDKLEEMKEDSKKMSHNIGTQQEYIKN